MKKFVLVTLLTLISSLASAADLLTLIKMAENRNLSIQISDIEKDQSYINQKDAYNDLIPDVNFGLSKSHTTFKDSYQKSNAFSVDSTTAYSIKLTQAYPGLGRIPWIKTKIAKLAVDIKDRLLDKSKITVIDEIVKLYFKLAKQKELAHVDKKNIILAEQLLAIANLNLEVGLILKNDVLRIEVEKYNYTSSQITAKKEFRNYMTDVLKVLNLPLTASFTLELPESLKFPKESLDEAELYKIMLDKDQDIAIAKTDLEILRKTIKMARSAHLPTLSLESSYNHGINVGSIKNTGDIKTTFVLSTPIYNGGQIENSVRLAKKSKKIAELRLNSILNVKKAALSKAIANYYEALDRIKFAEKTVEQSFENMKIVFSQYKEGATSIVELIDAQTIVTQSTKTAINAYYDERNRLASIYLITQQREKLDMLATGNAPMSLDFLFEALDIENKANN